MKYKRPELLAPAGDPEVFKAAVDHGADAVYIGYGKFNARANAANFSMEELASSCEYAHLRSCLVYLTLNTLVYENEIETALEIASTAYNCGVDAILVQDIGLASQIHKRYPDIPLHASTQMNINSTDDYRRLRDLGISRVVLPREFSLDEIRKHTQIAARYKIETEVFIHGAVCICYSGLCLFSGMNKSGSRSGNRGLCAQPCRQSYELADREGNKVSKGHLISPKDKSLTGYISELLSSGVASLKIEGRMRELTYVKTAVACYRNLIDMSYAGTLSENTAGEIEQMLLVSYNRGGRFTDQFMDGKKKKDLLSGEYVGKFGKLIGRVVGSEYKAGNLIIKTDQAGSGIVPSKGDYLSIRRHSREVSSFPAGKIQYTDGILTVKGLHPDQIKKIERGSDVYLMNHDFDLDKDAGRTHIDWSCDISDNTLSLNAVVKKGPFKGVYAQKSISSDPDKPISSVRIGEQLRKTGNTPFVCDNVYFTDEDAVFASSVSSINELRREILSMLEDEILSEASHYCSEEYDLFGDTSDEISAEEGRVTVLHYFPDLKTFDRDIYRGNSLYGFSVFDIMLPKTSDRIADFLISKNVDAVIVLPDAMHLSVRADAFRAVKAFAAKSRGHLIAVMDSDVFSSDPFYQDNGLKHFVSQGANIVNSYSLRTALSGCDGAALSYEVAKDDAYNIVSAVKTEGKKTVILHHEGDIPWMQSDFCPVGANKEHCRMCFDGPFVLRQSEGGPDLKVIGRPYDHTSVIYGPGKYNFDDDEVTGMTSLGFDVILVKTEL